MVVGSKGGRLGDVTLAIRGRELWTFLAWQDIRLRYRRSKIGPFWITLSMSIFCLSLGAVYSQLFGADLREYLPFLAVGFVFWALMSGMVTEFPNAFVDSAAYIKDVRVNPMSILFRLVTRHLITFLHNAVIVAIVFVWFGIFPGWTLLWALPGMALVVLNLTALGVSLSLFGARFRDVSPITQSLVQVLFFITPITWFPKLLPADAWVVAANPFAYYLDLTRSPLLGEAPALESWGVAFLTLLLFATSAAWLYSRKAARIPFWV